MVSPSALLPPGNLVVEILLSPNCVKSLISSIYLLIIYWGAQIGHTYMSTHKKIRPLKTGNELLQLLRMPGKALLLPHLI